jgi:hypothetical protein
MQAGRLHPGLADSAMTIRSTFERLIRHFETSNDTSLLDRTLRCFNGYLTHEEADRLRNLLLLQDFDRALNIIDSLAGPFGADTRLSTRLELMLFMVEQKQAGSVKVESPGAAMARDTSPGDEPGPNADVAYVLDESARMQPLLDFDSFVADRNAGEAETDGEAEESPIESESLPAQAPADSALQTVEAVPTVAHGESGSLDLEDLAVEVAADLEVLAEIEEVEHLPEDDLPAVSDLLPADDVFQSEVFSEAYADDLVGSGSFGELEDEYAAYAYDPDELYAAAEERGALSANKLTREERARQVAADLIARTNWDQSALGLLTHIFVMSGWSATRVAIEREILEGLIREELVLAAHLKAVWAENDYYWIAISLAGNTRLSNSILSWPTALKVVRSFGAIPQVEELEAFVEQLYEHWMETPYLRRAFRSFARFLWFRVANLEGCLAASEPFSFGNPHDLDLAEYSDLGISDIFDMEKDARRKALGVPDILHDRFWSTFYTTTCERHLRREEEREDMRQRSIEAAYRDSGLVDELNDGDEFDSDVVEDMEMEVEDFE